MSHVKETKGVDLRKENGETLYDINDNVPVVVNNPSAIEVQQADLDHVIDDTAVDAMPKNVQIYTDGVTYIYECFAISGSTLSSSIWRVKRSDATGNVRWAGGLPFSSPNYGYEHAATDLATVAALSYS